MLLLSTASVATAVMVVVPGASARSATVKRPPLTVAVRPLTVTLCRWSSLTTPVTVTAGAPMLSPSRGAVIVSCGATVSRTYSTAFEVASRPKLSVATATMTFVPSSASGTPSAVKLAPSTTALTPPTVRDARCGSSTAPSTAMVVAPTSRVSGSVRVTTGGRVSTSTATGPATPG